MQACAKLNDLLKKNVAIHIDKGVIVVLSDKYANI